jgi:hypothetical protein
MTTIKIPKKEKELVVEFMFVSCTRFQSKRMSVISVTVFKVQKYKFSGHHVKPSVEYMSFHGDPPISCCSNMMVGRRVDTQETAIFPDPDNHPLLKTRFDLGLYGIIRTLQIPVLLIGTPPS